MLKFSFRILKPWLLAFVIKKFGEKFESRFKQEFGKRYSSNQNAGPVAATKKNTSVINGKSSKKVIKNVGEYVDFEEIE